MPVCGGAGSEPVVIVRVILGPGNPEPGSTTINRSITQLSNSVNQRGESFSVATLGRGIKR